MIKSVESPHVKAAQQQQSVPYSIYQLAINNYMILLSLLSL